MKQREASDGVEVRRLTRCLRCKSIMALGAVNSPHPRTLIKVPKALYGDGESKGKLRAGGLGEGSS